MWCAKVLEFSDMMVLHYINYTSSY